MRAFVLARVALIASALMAPVMTVRPAKAPPQTTSGPPISIVALMGWPSASWIRCSGSTAPTVSPIDDR